MCISNFVSSVFPIIIVMCNMNTKIKNSKNSDNNLKTFYIKVGSSNLNTIVIQQHNENIIKTPKDLYKEIDKYLEKNNIKSKDYYLIYVGKILPRNSNSSLETYSVYNNVTLDLNFRLVGGGSLFTLIIDMFKAIGEVIVILIRAIVVISKMLAWFAQFAIWFFREFLDPFALITDMTGSIIKISRFVIVSMTDIFFAFTKTAFNTIFTPLFPNMWGWDYNTDKDNVKYSDNDDKSKNKKKTKGYKRCTKDGKICYNTGYDTVPFSVIIATILMPPLGLLMEFGISYWLNIFICAMLTLLFYIPGLLYALILIYC
jgi:uncharacterized membrane protein YqaE (UPF0057 family)